MATTAGGLPYVESSDLISGYPTVSQALAEELDDQLAAKGDVAGETWTGTHDFTGATVTGVSGGVAHIHTESFSAVSSVAVDSVFDSTYDNYAVIVRNDTSTDCLVRFRSSAADNTANNYRYAGPFVSATTNTAFSIAIRGKGAACINVQSPALAQYTMYQSIGGYPDEGTAVYDVMSGGHNSTTQFDGIKVYPSSGTFSGTISIYGYAKA